MVGREGLDPRALGRETQRRRKTRPSTRTPVAIHGLVVLGFHAQDHGACRLGFLLASCRMEGKCLCPVCRKKAILHQLWPTATLPPDVAPSNPSTRCGPTATPPPAVAPLPGASLLSVRLTMVLTACSEDHIQNHIPAFLVNMPQKLLMSILRDSRANNSPS